ncbi:hypothetical protein PHYBLDRAFT_67716 [Phycomyces blakesleeanus NRRL 1555(-)]|uniref:Uncharacterized protein n=1 Tax=Phycomyces blakesleeanus (strain ATCC 8743b / DSM 1359 / FGSC 10004 / NBRC 33097 / NRRL 1555) TaxID=763407 RepID=A0A162U8M8_PHYB8|nr:hypothetical protein PHYBLDRAFT_67716 [Phycomyces blakesleeanus NRRL 1555(-)]OAD74362.1 hypothetical protein PHYBLDRAFT_67716 [Phycomyces blakesleeanus NRRL 1555(-)]|eukprot:XP_018292402.1 hypothetical protein PHYBLDRAFT_67716 [Phycomyces blakesleeanus NRRL 1555(-)]
MDTSNVFSRGYIVRTPKESCSIGIEINHTNINIESFLSVNTTLLNISLCCSISPDTIILLIPTHHKLLEEEHFLKRLICDGTDQENNRRKYYKVKIASVILFSDNTSGNTSKQFNPYESWSMKCVGLSFEERCSIENILFISAIPKKKGANAASLLPEIVNDLKKLENGVVMFSAEDNAYVLVVSSLLWIEADTPCHSELCGLGAPNSTYPCRKCYIKLQSRIPKFGSALNYKTEKGEQFNKHIREHLFHTNHMNTSKDICLKFGKQYMTRHIIDGGSWIGKNGLRKTCEKAIAEYMQQISDGKFHETLLGGSREFADNNGTGLTPGKILKDNTFALFRQINRYIIIGIVLFSKGYYLYIKYPSAHAVNNNYHLALKYADDIYMPLDELKVVCLLDTHLKVDCKYVVNLNKFGSYWSFLYSFY